MHKFSAVELISKKLFLAEINFRNSTEWICCMAHHTSGVHLAGFGPLCPNGHKGYIPQHSSADHSTPGFYLHIGSTQKKYDMVLCSAQLIIINESS